MPVPTRQPWAALAETHTAALYFGGDRVLKVKKPVILGFLDFTSAAARRAACDAEVRLNRRLAPDVYLGVADIGVAGEPAEPAVLMRRLPADASLAAMVARDDDALPDAVTRVADVIADFHRRCAVVGEDLDFDVWRHPESLWRDNIAQARRLSPAELSAEELDVAEWLAERYVQGRSALFRERLAGGLVRDGHGDLLADDVFVLADAPRVLDCLEFDDHLRVGDVLLDVASLAMDLERLGRADLARLFLDKYAASAGEHHPTSLEHFYIAYRALVRAKVAAIRSTQTGGGSGSAADLLSICVRHLHAAQVTLTVVGGLPGSGKSTLAATIAARSHALMLSSDVVRWELYPGAACDGYAVGRYAPDASTRVYDELMRRARAALSRGEHVVLDATFTDLRHRTAARELAHDLAATVSEICVTVDDASAERRLAERPKTGGGGSDATADVRAWMAKRFAPWPEATVVNTGVAENEAVTTCS